MEKYTGGRIVMNSSLIMREKRREIGQCPHCGNKNIVKGKSLCNRCENKMKIPLSLLYKNKGGFSITRNIAHIVNEANKTVHE